MPINIPKFEKDIRTAGWHIISEKISSGLIDKLRKNTEDAVKFCEQFRDSSDNRGFGTAHNLLNQGEGFVELLSTFQGLPYIKHHLGENIILNSFAGTINPPSSSGYAHEIHRDIRFYANPCPMLNTLILLNDFTIVNGGTFVLTGSHLIEQKPSEIFFFKYADQIISEAGTILIFDSNIWHASGLNRSSANRQAVSMTFTYPEIKPQFDYGNFINKLDEKMAKLLKINIPNSLQQWYHK